MPLTIGSRIGADDIRALLGAGGMDEVYDAYDTRLRRRVAINVVAGVANGEQRERFEREARLLATLSHPNIVTIHGIEENDAQLLLVMELVHVRPLTEGLLGAVWSPGGDRVAFALGMFFQVLTGPAIADLAVVNRDNSGLKILTGGDGNVGFPSCVAAFR